MNNLKWLLIPVLLTGVSWATEEPVPPDILEFYTPLYVHYSGGLFSGAKNKQTKKEAEAYWTQRKTALATEVQTCKASKDVASCYILIRGLEQQKTEDYKKGVNLEIEADAVRQHRQQEEINQILGY